MKHLSEATGVPVRTLYDWRKSRPELMKIIKLGVACATLIKNREEEKSLVHYKKKSIAGTRPPSTLSSWIYFRCGKSDALTS